MPFQVSPNTKRSPTTPHEDFRRGFSLHPIALIPQLPSARTNAFTGPKLATTKTVLLRASATASACPSTAEALSFAPNTYVTLCRRSPFLPISSLFPNQPTNQHFPNPRANIYFLIAHQQDGENFDSPLPTDWVSGAFYDIAKDPSSPEKECYIARHYFESGDDLTQPIADTSNFYCGCWYNSKACKPWIPKWVPHGPHVDNSDPTCQDVCASKGLVVVDHTGSQLSYNWICRESSIKAHIGYEHYNGTEMTNVCHFVSQDDMDAGSYNDYSSLYDCLCQRK